MEGWSNDRMEATLSRLNSITPLLQDSNAPLAVQFAGGVGPVYCFACIRKVKASLFFAQ